jgi:PadR family transcriptional regulator PadR
MGLQLWITQFRKGLVELCVMATLAEDEAYGYQIVERLGQISGLTITESTVYPLLARLGRDHLLSVRTAASPTGPPRRYYRLTEAGQRRLKEMAAYWQEMQLSVQDLLKGVMT